MEQSNQVISVTSNQQSLSQTQQVSSFQTVSTSSASLNNASLINDIENTSDLFCETHKQDKEYIILEDLGNFKKLTPLCNICSAELQRQFKRKPNMESYMTVIYANSQTIMNIKKNNLNIANFHQGTECKEVFNQTIQVLTEELAFVCNEFSTQFIQVVDNSNSNFGYSAENIRKIQNFIDNIKLQADGSPCLQDIGAAENRDLRIKYIKLAGFLLRFEGFSALMEASSSSFAGISGILRGHIVRIIDIRRRLVAAITEWLKFLLGPFYEFTFGLEKSSLDAAFRSSHFSLVDYIGENININNFNITMHRDYLLLQERIRVLEKENAELRESPPENDNLEILNKRILYLEGLISNYQTEITNLSNNSKTEITHIINRQKTEFVTITKNYELKITELNLQNSNFVQQLESFRRQIDLLTKEREEWRLKYDQSISSANLKFESYIIEINNLKKERETIVSRSEQVMAELQARFEAQISQYNTIIRGNEEKIRQWETEAAEWKLKFDQVSIKTSHYEEKINQLNILVNKHVEKITIINGQIGEWERKYRLIITERDGHAEEAQNLRDEIVSASTSHSESRISIIREAEGKIRYLEDEVAQLKFKNDQLINRIAEYEKRISELNFVITRHTETSLVINNEVSDWKSKYEMLLVERDNYFNEAERLRGEVHNSSSLTQSHVEKHTIIINETQEIANRYKKEAYDWQVKFENLQKQIQFYEHRLSELNLVINRHTETSLVINNEVGDWKSKYELLKVERDNYFNEAERLRGEVHNSSSLTQSHVEKHTIIIREKEERMNHLIQEAEGWKLKYETLNRRLKDYEQRISELQIQINGYTEQLVVVQGEEWESKYWAECKKGQILGEEIERLNILVANGSKTVEKNTEKYVLLVKEKEGFISGLQNEILGFKMELNSKISIISRLEMTLRSYEDKIAELNLLIEKLNKDLAVCRAENTNEVQRHLLIINTCKEEFFNLSESYESLLLDIKHQISINEALRKLVIELMNKIEEHNQTIGSLDVQIRQQIETLTRQTLSKKYIDALPSIELVSRSEKEIVVLRNKVGKMETEKLHKSGVFHSSSQDVIELVSSNAPSRHVTGSIELLCSDAPIRHLAETVEVFHSEAPIRTKKSTNISSSVTNQACDGYNNNVYSSEVVSNNVYGGLSNVQVHENRHYVNIQNGTGVQQGGFNYLQDLDELRNIQNNLNSMHRNITTTNTVQRSELSSSSHDVNVGTSQNLILEVLSNQVSNNSVHLNSSEY